MSDDANVTSDVLEDKKLTSEMEDKTMDLHGTVSSEEQLPEEADEVQTADDFAGYVDEVGLEDVEGFDPAHALSEGIEADEQEVSEELEALPCCGELEFDEPESICDEDNRVRISPAINIPWRWNCQLVIERANGSGSRCTGFFIGPRAVVTSGHCVYSHAAGGWARKIEVIPGCDASARPFGSQVSTRFISTVGYVRDRNREYDYGCIVLPDTSLGRRVGYFGFASLPASRLNGLVVNNAGYAGDKPFGTLWFNAGRITTVTDRMLYYMIDTYGGHSGSPVWWLATKDGRLVRYVVGVHGYGGCPNKAVRITAPVFSSMLAWRAL